MEKLISVIIPVYNVENFIKRSIESLTNQSFTNFEALVIDDGSTDNSINIAKEIAGNDKRFIFLTKENGGLSDARNYGIERANGKYLSFLDSDDYFDDYFLEKMYHKTINENADICICDICLVKEDGGFIRNQKSKYINTISGEEAFTDNIQSISITSGAQNKLYKKELFEDTKYPKGLYYEDRATTYKLFLKSNRVAFVNESLFFYVQREGSIMNGLSKKKLDDRFIVMESINDYLKEKNIFDKYQNEFKICYLLNIPLSGASMIAMYSNEYNKEINNFLRRADTNYFDLTNIFLLKKNHTKKMIALLLLKLCPSIFKYLLIKEKSKNF